MNGFGRGLHILGASRGRLRELKAERNVGSTGAPHAALPLDGVPPGDVSRSQSPNKTMDLLARHMPPCRATPTPLPDRLHLALVGKDDGSLQAKLPQIIIIIIIIITIII